MLNTRKEIIDEVVVRLGVSTTAAFYDDTTLSNWIDQAHQWAAGYHKWPFTEGKVSTTYTSTLNELGDDVKDYPEGWKTDSIRYLQIGGKRLQKITSEDFQRYRESLSSGTDYIYTDFARQFYINPNTGLTGTLTVWGQYSPASFDATDENATTVFSGFENDGNEAIVFEMMSYGKKKEGKLQESITLHQQAVEVLTQLATRYKEEQSLYQTKDRGIFNRIDVLNGLQDDELFHRDRFY